jgi:hypothetical protein
MAGLSRGKGSGPRPSLRLLTVSRENPPQPEIQRRIDHGNQRDQRQYQVQHFSFPTSMGTDGPLPSVRRRVGSCVGKVLENSDLQGNFAVTGGAGGIRTLDRALQPYNGLANRRLQPLGHSSVTADMPEAEASRKRADAGRRIPGHLVTPGCVI